MKMDSGEPDLEIAAEKRRASLSLGLSEVRAMAKCFRMFGKQNLQKNRLVCDQVLERPKEDDAATPVGTSF